MTNNLPKRWPAISSLGILIFLSACQGAPIKEAKELGTLSAGLQFPPTPPPCKEQFGHAKLQAGDEAVSVLKRERTILDAANRRILTCYEDRENARRQFGKAIAAPVPKKLAS